MQSVDELKAGLKQVNGSLYLGPRRDLRVKTLNPSSMVPVVNAVDAYHAAPTGDRMLQLITAIRDIPPVKKMKYQHALNALYATFPQAIYVSAEPFALSTTQSPVGIEVIRSSGVPSHQLDAVLALQELHDRGVAGRGLLHDIVINSAQGNPNTYAGEQRRVSVAATAGGNTCQAGSYAGRGDTRSKLAAALSGRNAHDMSTEIGAAMTRLHHDPAAQGSFVWLQDAINDMPIYRLAGLPNTQTSSAQHGNNWISATMLQDSVTNDSFPTGLPANRVDDAQMALGAVLAGGANRGEGAHSTVRWNASNTTSAGQQRPSFIGLGHELIHAYHNQLGDQPGNDFTGVDPDQVTDTVLYEYLSVGIGPFERPNGPVGTNDIAKHTENGLRASANLPLRDRYD
jgi:Effector protein